MKRLITLVELLNEKKNPSNCRLIGVCTCRTIKPVMKQRFLRSSLIYNVTKSCSRWNNMNTGERIEKKGRKTQAGGDDDDDGIGSIVLIVKVHNVIDADHHHPRRCE